MAVIKAAVEKRGNELLEEARRAGRREPREAYLMDALEQICREWLEGRRPASVGSLLRGDTTTDESSADEGVDEGDDPADRNIAPQASKRSPAWLGLLRIDIEALRRGGVEGEELCEISGLGPIPVSIARALLGESVLKLVITRGVDVLNVTHLGRGPTVAQRIALLWNNPGCSITGCGRIAGVQIDHTADWADTRHTVLDELQRLCDHHHDLKTHRQWAAICGPDGAIVMVSPDDPRHPSRAGPTEAAPDDDDNRRTASLFGDAFA